MISESKLLDFVCEEYAELSGSCPRDMHDWQHPKGCNEVCDLDLIPDCWRLYFEEQARAKAGRFGGEFVGWLGEHFEAILDSTQPIVRCRDCKHSGKNGTLCDWFSAYEPVPGGDEFCRIAADVEPNGYCAWGERKAVER